MLLEADLVFAIDDSDGGQAGELLEVFGVVISDSRWHAAASLQHLRRQRATGSKTKVETLRRDTLRERRDAFTTAVTVLATHETLSPRLGAA
jgi:hypothetical protein